MKYAGILCLFLVTFFFFYREYKEGYAAGLNHTRVVEVPITCTPAQMSELVGADAALVTEIHKQLLYEQSIASCK